MSQYAEALAACVAYIKRQQQADGSFLAYAGALGRPDLFDLKTPFVTSLILGCLNPNPTLADAQRQSKHIHDIALAGSKFLLREKTEHLTWNYWPKGPQAAKKISLPDDLDDTFLALTAIQQHNKSLITSETFPQIIKILTSTEIKPGGPYNTWVINDIYTDPWHDIDVVVNSNIGYFLKQNNIELPALQALAEETIRTEQYKTRYYYSFHSILYFISRFYTGSLKQRAIDYILSQQHSNGTWGNPLFTSLCVSALYNFGYTGTKTTRAITALIVTTKTGDWSHQPLYIEEAKDTLRYTGSYALTTAFVYEAIEKHAQAQSTTIERSLNKNSVPPKNNELEKMLRTVHQNINKLFTHTAPTSQKVIKKSVETITGYDTAKEIPLLPYHTKCALHKKFNRKISDKMSTALGTANTLGWIAYTIYDDILDQEGKLEHLSIANTALRELTRIYSTLLPTKHHPLFSDIMTRLDEANRWEYLHARIPSGTTVISVSMIPDYKDLSILAEKSFGHALAPLTIFLNLGITPTAKEFKQLCSFFKHYLIARQLNDDAHDWREDLDRGFFNPVSCIILQHYFRQQKSQSRRSDEFEPIRYPIPSNNTILQQIFWDTTIGNVADLIHRHLKSARRALKQIPQFTNTDYYLSLLAPIERSAEQAVTESREMKKFLQAYQ